MADCGEVHPDLMGATRLEASVNQGVAGQRLEHLEVGAGLAGPCPLDGSLRPLAPVAPQRGVDRARAARKAPLDQRRVLALHLTRLDHSRQCPVRAIVAGDEQQPRGVLVEPVDDPRPLRLPATEESPEQVYESLPLHRRCRVHDQAGGLLHHRQVVVQVDDQTLGLPCHSRFRPASERSTSKSSKSTPATIATSARLKVGHTGRSMKSVTAPSRARSARLPSAPPSRSAAGTQSSQPVRARAARKTSRPSSTKIVAPMTTAGMSPPSPNATPRFRTFARCRKGRISIRSPRSTSALASAFVP